MKMLRMNDPLPLRLGARVGPPVPAPAAAPVDIDLGVKWVDSEELAYSDLRHSAFAAYVDDQLRAVRVPIEPTSDDIEAFYRRVAKGEVGEGERVAFENRLADMFRNRSMRTVTPDALLDAAERLAEGGTYSGDASNMTATEMMIRQQAADCSYTINGVSGFTHEQFAAWAAQQQARERQVDLLT